MRREPRQTSRQTVADWVLGTGAVLVLVGVPGLTTIGTVAFAFPFAAGLIQGYMSSMDEGRSKVHVLARPGTRVALWVLAILLVGVTVAAGGAGLVLVGAPLLFLLYKLGAWSGTQLAVWAQGDI